MTRPNDLSDIDPTQFAIHAFCHYGFLANRSRRDKLARIRRALAVPPPQTTHDTAETAAPGYPCPKCRRGTLRVLGLLAPTPPAWVPPG